MQPSELIKEKLDIVEVLKGYIDMKPAGRNYKARCPFHNEKTPSFMVSPDRQMWHCFGCGAGGDMFKFVMEYENIEFYEALKLLAEKAGIELKGLSGSDFRQFGVLYEINAVVKDFYRAQLSENPAVSKYLAERGLEEKTIEEFELGFAPNSFDATAAYLMKKGYKVSDILRAGIIFKTDGGKYGDRFRGRVVFPIHNHFGKVVGFSSRILPQYETQDSAKYINSPETDIFDKSKLMYGFWRTKQNIRAKKMAVLVEGQMDFLLAYQAGVDNTVATSGTALTPAHLKVLKPIADNIVLAYDSDEAGLSAAERAIDLLGSHDFNVAVLDLGPHKDPADAATADKDFLNSAVDSARPAMQHYFDRYLAGDFDRKIAIRAILQKIARLFSQIDKANWLSELSYRVGISEADLREEMDKLGFGSEARTTDQARPAAPEAVKPSRLEAVSLRALGLAFTEESFRPLVNPKLEYMPERFRLAYRHMLGSEPEEGARPSEDIRRLADYISLSAGASYDTEKEEQALEIESLLYELELEYWKLKNEKLKNEIRLAELKNDEETLTEKLKEFDTVSRRIQDIKRSRGQSAPKL